MSRHDDKGNMPMIEIPVALLIALLNGEVEVESVKVHKIEIGGKN